MPLIEISMYPGRTKEQKEAFAKAITNAAVEILKTKPKHVIVTYDGREKEYRCSTACLASNVNCLTA
jgi:4-oxalocrotonate tautomerase